MSARRQCPQCGKIGFVRVERVIKAGAGVSELACGACAHAWREADDASIRDDAPPAADSRTPAQKLL
jgi:hypothetical protein